MGKAKGPVAKLNTMHHIGYGAGDAGGVVMLMLISYLERFSRNVLGVDPVIYAGILVVWNVWDAINDPLVGTFMDVMFTKAKNKTNKFRPWILRSIPILAVGLISLFTLPTLFDGMLCIVVLFLSKIVFELGYTVMNIGMGSLLGVMATNDAERASLSSARGFGSTVGGMIGAMALPVVLSSLGETAFGFGATAAVAAALGCFLVFIHYTFTVERNVAAQNAVKTEAEKEAEKVKITDILNVFKVNRPYLALCVHSICICFVQGIAQGASAYMYSDVLGNLALQSIGSVISMPVMFGGLIIAPILAKKFDLVKIIRTFILVGCILLGTCFIYATTAEAMIPVLYIAWSGIGTGLVTLSVQLQWGLVGESIDYNEYLTGKRSEGAIYGTFSLTRRVGQTLSGSLAVLMLSWFGYQAGAGTAQPASAIWGIKAMVILIPAVIAMGSWASFRFIWNIDDKERAKVAAWKAERAAKAEATDAE
ncbi:MAG: MFS transporter [Agathobacter sp.]|nr:MFS transporter [Agathobacter sp.]